MNSIKRKLGAVTLGFAILFAADAAYAVQLICDMSGCVERCVGDVCGMKCSVIICHN